jgi:hypothetical protein
MRVPLWVTELATTFWELAGELEPFPRSLQVPILGALPLAIVRQPALTTAAVRAWLQHRGIAVVLDTAGRPLRACLIARDGGGLIFLDCDDPPAEQRFSLAHELAHFLRHYWQPRERARDRLGEAILDVFDGVRPPQPSERMHGLLAGAPLGHHAHLLDRDIRRAGRPEEISVAEDEADRLAYELLAPAAAVAARLPLTAGENGPAAAKILQDVFGLPSGPARDYTTLLLPDPPADPLVRWLRQKS